MKPRSAQHKVRSFADLREQIKRKKIRLPEVHLPEPPSRAYTLAEEKALFMKAMKDVDPLETKVMAGVRKGAPVRKPDSFENPDSDSVRQLKRLVETGEGFVLRFTSEYMEGAGTCVPPELFRRLHSGYFSIQGHLDLHGMGVKTAKRAFDRFLKRSVELGFRAVLIVHGRGRRSPGPPVLKRNLVRWLTQGVWKNWVIAYTSARACDGGTGATYVLLRKKREKRLSLPNQ
jgi:DNA-nicking Smr family endonuclease